ncbi:MAG: 1-(5-phosphoribosyl)-5-[(5-phosphoribosylamino)methylideneamino]imidazole-4-carboxamide isomerase, partial [Candidatus Omnitrophica bacterium]|nr:1-(5-phosphoribosyl)-5-[(5-phosphoribosylamino)methylideneamino]imidazole-4-carboxamide isomerase [Candidatus Omnitrophota bacterium]
MLIIPAIDIKDGCVVRFVQGRHNKKIYSRNPAKTARHWVKQGAKVLHVVDLDGALSGRPKNLSTLKEIIAAVNIPVEFGGGVRDRETIKRLLGMGVERTILGTRAIEDEDFLKMALSRFGKRIIVSLDARGDNILIGGWQRAAKKKNIVKFACKLKEMGFKEMIYTDTIKDGTLTGPNIKGIKSLLKVSGLEIIASGGICSLEDIYKLKLLEKKGLKGIIIGKALYEGRFTLAEALK